MPSIAVLHFALNPVTGVWSVMKQLALGQSKSGLYKSVGVGVIADARWPQLYRDELSNLPMQHFSSNTIASFGTLQFLWQRIMIPPIKKWALEFLDQSGADSVVVHCHNAWLSGVFLPLGLDKKGKFVATFHGVNAGFQGQPVRRMIHRQISARLTKHRAILTSVDRANLDRAENILGMNRNDFVVVPNGIADTVFRRKSKSERARQLTLGHCGSMEYHKGWKILVDAALKLRLAGEDVRVILAGRGSNEAEVRSLANTSGGWLEFRGFVANPRENLLPELDALVLMSEQEGLPMAIIEALSVGVPVIATAVGGVPEAIVDGVNGLLIPRSVDDLAKAIKKLLDNQETFCEMGKQARLSFENYFEISRIVEKYDSVYQTSS